jgi:hypothetical protein
LIRPSFPGGRFLTVSSSFCGAGVESVAADVAAGKVVVTGPADAAELKDRVESRTKKPVLIVSAGAGQPKNDKKADKEKGGGGEKKAEKEKGSCGGGDKKSKKEEKQPKETKEVSYLLLLACLGGRGAVTISAALMSCAVHATEIALLLCLSFRRR